MVCSLKEFRAEVLELLRVRQALDGPAAEDAARVASVESVAGLQRRTPREWRVWSPSRACSG